MTEATGSIGMMAVKALGLLIDAVDEVSPQSWDQPSRLEGWSCRDLVAHATGSATKIATLLEDGEIRDGPSRPADWTDPDPGARLRELAARFRAALPGADLDAMRVSPEGQVPLRRALAFPVADLAIHSWDLHRAQGRLVELPDDLLALCRGLVESVPEARLRRPGGFGPPQPAPDDATPTARMMAFLGRSVSTA